MLLVLSHKLYTGINGLTHMHFGNAHTWMTNWNKKHHVGATAQVIYGLEWVNLFAFWIYAWSNKLKQNIEYIYHLENILKENL